MRNIESPEKKEKKRKRNRLIIGIVLIGVMVLSTVGFALLQGLGVINNNSGNEIEYNGIKFTQDQNGYWASTIQGISFLTLNNPKDTEEIPLEIRLDINEIYQKPLYFVTDDTEAMNELAGNIGRFASRYQEVCLNGEKCENDYVEKTCEDNIIVIKTTNETKIYKEENCIFLESTRENHLLISDKLIFRIFEIQ